MATKRRPISEPTLSLSRLTSMALPRVPFLILKDAILGKRYLLSLVFPTTSLSEKLHRKWKKKSGPANVLSFPLTPVSGEIFITLEKAKKDHAEFELSYRNYVAYLFIHGCLHLKGMRHGATMERMERRFMALLDKRR